MEFKNIEAVWAHAKSKLPKGAVISNISKTGSTKYFDLVIPRTLVKVFPEDSNRGDLVYSFSEVGGTTEVYLENNGLSMDVYDTKDFREAVGQFLGLNESRINEQEVYSVEDTHLMGYDKCIIFGMWMSPKEANAIFGKITKDYHLDPLPDGEAMLYVKKKDEKKFLDAINKLIESDLQDDYQEFFKKKLDDYNVSSPSELNQEDRSQFFAEIKAEWKEEKSKLKESFPSNAIATGKVSRLSPDEYRGLSTREIIRKLADVKAMMSTYANSATEDSFVAYRELDVERLSLLGELKLRGGR